MIPLKPTHFRRIKYHHTQTEFPDPSKFERHCHDGYELIYVVRGYGKYIVEGAEYPLAPNTILFLRPYEYHYVCPQNDCIYERYVIHFSEEMLLDTVRKLSIVQAPPQKARGMYFQKEAVNTHIRSQFEILDLDVLAKIDQATQLQVREDSLLRTAINQILIHLSYLQAEKPQKAENDWVREVMYYLNANLSREITLEETAKNFFVSKYHLCHAFREYTGISVFAYVHAKRIALAEQLLAEGIAATEVADRIGYRDYSVFYRAYRKSTGKSPSAAKAKGKE